MRVMFMIKGDPEPGAAPSEELLAAMGRYNDELQQAGVLLDLAGLLPSAEGRRVKFAEGGARHPGNHRRAWNGSGECREQVPLAGHPAEGLDAPVLEPDLGSGDQVLDGTGHQRLVRPGQTHDPRG